MNASEEGTGGRTGEAGGGTVAEAAGDVEDSSPWVR